MPTKIEWTDKLVVSQFIAVAIQISQFISKLMTYILHFFRYTPCSAINRPLQNKQGVFLFDYQIRQNGFTKQLRPLATYTKKILCFQWQIFFEKWQDYPKCHIS